MNLSLDIGNQV